VSGKIEADEKPEEAVVREVQEELGIAVRPLARVWECVSSDGLYWLHWWLAEPVREDFMLSLNEREVDSARWLNPTEFRGLGKVFEPDLRFFEEIFPTLGE
jgi:8-oxo-dGTP pyrophosphatase MutT (NUDIX family)